MLALENKELFNIGTIHFCGIGGIGMSGIAEILHNLGYKIQGSDIANNANVERLLNLGVKVVIGQEEDNITNCTVVVRSSAIKDMNPEILAARKANIPVISRAEMLAEIMKLKSSIAIAGTHGKTTTTSIIARFFGEANLNPTVINGGIINSRNTNAYLGSGDWVIAEADESDGSFLKLPHNIAVVTNIDREHMEHYGSYENLKNAFIEFIEAVPFYGFAVLCVDHLVVKEISNKIIDRKIITYAVNNDADVKATNIRSAEKGSIFDVEFSTIFSGKSEKITDIYLPMFGIHNVENSLAGIAICKQLNFNIEIIKNALPKFMGVKRRLTITGIVGGITVIDDYAHHPKEILATLKAVNDMSIKSQDKGKVIAIFQPHRYSRTKDLFTEFSKCFTLSDYVFILDIFAAGENEIPDINNQSLAKEISKQGHKQVRAIADSDDIANVINNIANQNDIVICLGAGTITKIAANLPAQLSKINGWG